MLSSWRQRMEILKYLLYKISLWTFPINFKLISWQDEVVPNTANNFQLSQIWVIGICKLLISTQKSSPKTPWRKICPSYQCNFISKLKSSLCSCQLRSQLCYSFIILDKLVSESANYWKLGYLDPIRFHIWAFPHKLCPIRWEVMGKGKLDRGWEENLL